MERKTLTDVSIIPSDYKRADLPFWRNMFENMSSVQTNHRFLAYTTYTLVLAAFVAAFTLRLPRGTKFAAGFAFLMANMQAATGIYTVINQSPLHHAWSHQMCSLILLASIIYLLQTLRRPNKLVLHKLKLLRQPGPVYNNPK
jgi:heme a synthase